MLVSLSGGGSKDAELAKRETELADKLGKKTVDLWKANESLYESHLHDLGFGHFCMDDRYVISITAFLRCHKRDHMLVKLSC